MEIKHDLIVYEGGKPRTIPQVQTVLTDLEDGGTCEWAPGENFTFGKAKLEYNGEHTAEEHGYYGLSEVEVDVKNDLGDWNVSIDEDGFPHIETEDFDLTIDENGFPDLGDLDLNEAIANIDFDGNFDISLDDMNFNLDTLDTDFQLNLDTLELTETELPDEIRIMHVPDKTSYKDGEEIDLDGIIVQAYRNGEVWNDESGRYIDGYVPAHELIVSADTSYYPDSAGYLKTVPPDSEFERFLEVQNLPLQAVVRSGGTVSGLERSQYVIRNNIINIDGHEYRNRGTLHVTRTRTITIPQNVSWVYVRGNSVGGSYWKYNGIILAKKGDSFSFTVHLTIDHKFEPQDGTTPQTFHDESEETITVTSSNRNARGYRPYGGGYNLFQWQSLYENTYDAVNNLEQTTTPNVEQYQGIILTTPVGSTTYVGNDFWFCALLLDGDIAAGPLDTGKAYVSWPRIKDNKLLTALFDITIEPSEGGE